ncbi:hypothetical protein BH11VER1_BH11VER1_42050 [soil metagenome]
MQGACAPLLSFASVSCSSSVNSISPSLEKNPPKYTKNHTEDNISGLPLSETALPKLLRDSGYATGWVGKWHLGASNDFHPMSRGFTDAFGFVGGGHQYFAEGLTNPKVEYLTPLQRNMVPLTETGYLTDIFGHEAITFVEKHSKEPFFLYLAFNCPHTPLQASEKYLSRVSQTITDTKRKTYAAMIIAQDDAVGALVQKLGELGIEENTLICFISDNGGPIGEHGNGSSNGALRDGKGSVYEGGIRVPFFLRWKGTLPSGKEYPKPVISLDLTKTALALAGGKEADGKAMDGVNLIPFLQDKQTGAPHEALYWRTGGGDKYAVRSGALKLVKLKDKPAELYDLASDVSESHDLSSTQPESLKILEALRVSWNAELIAPVFGGPSVRRTKDAKTGAK